MGIWYSTISSRGELEWWEGCKDLSDVIGETRVRIDGWAMACSLSIPHSISILRKAKLWVARWSRMSWGSWCRQRACRRRVGCLPEGRRRACWPWDRYGGNCQREGGWWSSWRGTIWMIQNWRAGVFWGVKDQHFLSFNNDCSTCCLCAKLNITDFSRNHSNNHFLKIITYLKSRLCYGIKLFSQSQSVFDINMYCR